jgi:ribosomal protein S21
VLVCVVLKLLVCHFGCFGLAARRSSWRSILSQEVHLVGYRQVGDIVRVRSARRRDVRFSVVEITETHVRAVNEAGGEAFYEHDRFEPFVERSELETPRNSESLASGAVEIPSDSVRATPVRFAFSVPNDSGLVRPWPGEHIDSTLHRFKRSCERANIPAEDRRHRHFSPKPQRRREKSKRAKARRAKAGLG